MSPQHSERLDTCPVAAMLTSGHSYTWGALEPMIHIPAQGEGTREFSYAPPSYYQALRELVLDFHRKTNFFPPTLFLISPSFFPFSISPPLSSWENSWLLTGGLSVFSPTLELRRNRIFEKQELTHLSVKPPLGKGFSSLGICRAHSGPASNTL